MFSLLLSHNIGGMKKCSRGICFGFQWSIFFTIYWRLVCVMCITIRQQQDMVKIESVTVPELFQSPILRREHGRVEIPSANNWRSPRAWELHYCTQYQQGRFLQMICIDLVWKITFKGSSNTEFFWAVLAGFFVLSNQTVPANHVSDVAHLDQCTMC